MRSVIIHCFQEELSCVNQLKVNIFSVGLGMNHIQHSHGLAYFNRLLRFPETVKYSSETSKGTSIIGLRNKSFGLNIVYKGRCI